MRLIPLFLSSRSFPIKNTEVWSDPKGQFVSMLNSLSNRTIASIRVSRRRPDIYAPFTYTLLGAKGSGANFTVSFSNSGDVIPTNEEAKTLLNKDGQRDVSICLGTAKTIWQKDDAREEMLSDITKAIAQTMEQFGAELWNSADTLYYGPHYASLDYQVPYSPTLAAELGNDRMTYMTKQLGNVENDRFIFLLDIGLHHLSGHARFDIEPWDVGALTSLIAHEQTPITTLY